MLSFWLILHFSYLMSIEKELVAECRLMNNVDIKVYSFGEVQTDYELAIYYQGKKLSSIKQSRVSTFELSREYDYFKRYDTVSMAFKKGYFVYTLYYAYWIPRVKYGYLIESGDPRYQTEEYLDDSLHELAGVSISEPNGWWLSNFECIAPFGMEDSHAHSDFMTDPERYRVENIVRDRIRKVWKDLGDAARLWWWSRKYGIE